MKKRQEGAWAERDRRSRVTTSLGHTPWLRRPPATARWVSSRVDESVGLQFIITNNWGKNSLKIKLIILMHWWDPMTCQSVRGVVAWWGHLRRLILLLGWLLLCHRVQSSSTRLSRVGRLRTLFSTKSALF